MDYPRLRPLEVFPVEHEGKQMICFRDPQGYLEGLYFLPAEFFPIVQHFDGNHSLRDIQASYMRRFGQLIYTEQLEALVQELDRALLLDSEHFQNVVAERDAAFRRQKVRPSCLAGRSYPKEAQELERLLERCFRAPSGPGPLEEACEPDGRLAGLVAPHIDYGRGGACYAHAYKALRESCRASCFVILGTCHRPMSRPFALTRKAFQTPFGLVPADGGFIESLQSRVDHDLFADEIAHRAEHTIELQVVLLQYVLSGLKAFRVVPILVGSFEEALGSSTSPMSLEPIGAFIEALRETLDEAPEEVCLVASADLAHVGPRFGDPSPVGPTELERVRRQDQALMEQAVAADPEGFFQEILAQGNRNRICGFPPIYTMLAALEDGLEGELLFYGQWPDAQATVTFASLAFRRPGLSTN